MSDDGSECITPAELYAELAELDNHLTLKEVVDYMVEAERALGGGEGDMASDQQLSFDEFVRLFPERMRHLRGLEDRHQGSQSHGEHMNEQLQRLHGKGTTWIKTMETRVQQLEDAGWALLQARKSGDLVTEIQDHFTAICDLLSNTPGSDGLGAPARKSRKKKDDTIPCFGYETFLQEKAAMEHWPSLIDAECKRVRSLLGRKKGNANKVDRFAVHDAVLNVLNKVKHVITWSKEQMEEYESLAEAMISNEQPMGPHSLSGRGLALMPGEEANEQQAQDDPLGDEGTSGKSWLHCW